MKRAQDILDPLARCARNQMHRAAARLLQRPFAGAERFLVKRIDLVQRKDPRLVGQLLGIGLKLATIVR